MRGVWGPEKKEILKRRRGNEGKESLNRRPDNLKRLVQAGIGSEKDGPHPTAKTGATCQKAGGPKKMFLWANPEGRTAPKDEEV